MKLLCDRQYLNELLPGIGKARQSIDARIFLIDPGRGQKSSALKILTALAGARQRGVRVAIQTDNIFQNKPSGKRLLEAARKLKLNITWDKKETCLHEKTVVLDVRVLLIGSHNWSDPSLEENHEVSVKFSRMPPLVEGKDLSVRASARIHLETKSRLDAPAFAKQLIDDVDHAAKEILLATFDIDESSSPYEFGTKITDALLRAAARGVKTTVLLDASELRVPETGEICYHLRGLKKAEELARGGCRVFYDTTQRLLHAKVCVIDRSLAFVGSQNLEMRRDVTALESTARISDRLFSGKILNYIENILSAASPYFYEPPSLVGMPIPLSFLSKKGILKKLFTRKGFTLFPFYLQLLRLAWQGRLNPLREHFTVTREFRYRLLKLKRVYRSLNYTYLGANRHHSLDQVNLLDPGTGKPFNFPVKDFWILPDTFFDNGWLERLRPREMFVYFIHLARLQTSASPPYWSMRNRDIARTYGIDCSSLAHATVRLEKWNLLDVIRDPRITIKNVPKKPNRYRVNLPWNPEENTLIKQQMLAELSLGEKDLKEAEKLAAVLNQDHDLEVIRKFLLLIDRYGLDEVRKAVRITARFKHQFALRSVGYAAAILRNWSLGIRKN